MSQTFKEFVISNKSHDSSIGENVYDFAKTLWNDRFKEISLA